MPGVTDILSGLFKVAKQIYDQVELAKANKSQCQTLAKRVAIVVKATEKLGQLKDADQYRPALVELEYCLNECLTYIQTFVQQKSWFKQVFKAGNDKERFALLNKRLQETIPLLNLGLDAQQIINREQDSIDQKADYAHILEQQDVIIKLNQEANQQLGEIKLQQAEQKIIIEQQLLSMRGHLLALGKPPKKPLIDPHLMIPYYDLQFQKKLAEGSFGKVYLGRWCEQSVAIKSLGSEHKASDLEEITREVAIMARLRNNHIVQLYGACIEVERPCLVMEHVEKGSLYTVLGEEKLSAAQQKQLATDIAKGLHYLHTQSVVHRDIKSANVLVTAQGRAKLTDFGLSKIRTTSISPTHKASNNVAWQAPECLQRQRAHTPQSDIYSYGVVLWEIATGKRPFADCKDEEEVVGRIVAGKHETVPKDIPAVYTKLIQACWHKDPQKRPALTDIIHALEAYQLDASNEGEAFYQQGIGHEKQGKFAEAYAAYQSASGLQYVKAHTNLGFFLLKGTGGVKQDKAAAYQCFIKAANQGHVRAMMNAATMLEQGDGIKQNIEQALDWYQRAAKAGDTGAASKAQKLRAMMAGPVLESAGESARYVTAVKHSQGDAKTLAVETKVYKS